MKNMRKLLIYAAAFIVVDLLMPSMPFGIEASLLSAQSAPVRTTLASAMVSSTSCTTNCQIAVTSATGIVASTTSLQFFCLIDTELVQVRSISGTTLTVLRDRRGFAPGHVSGESIICGYTGTFNPGTGTISTVVGSPTVGASVTGATFVSVAPTGSCTRSQNGILPVFGPFPGGSAVAVVDGFTADCLGGSWIVGTLPDIPPATPLVLACNISGLGQTAYSNLGTSTQTVAGTFYRASIVVPKTAFLTGIQILNGGTGVTDSMYAALEDSGGTVMYQSNTATVSSGANIFESIPFTSAGFVLGPARYFIRYQSNGANAQIRLLAANATVDVVTTTATGTFGTSSALAVPKAFQATAGPIACLYY